MKTIALPPQQRGVTLLELLIGLAVGLLVVAVAMSALLVSRGISGTVTDATDIQQQAAYAMRMIGGQLRQAGSLYLNPDSVDNNKSTNPLSTVVFETDAIPKDQTNYLSFKQDNTISSDTTTGNLSITFRRYRDPVFTDAAPITLARNCLGGPSDTLTPKAASYDDEAVESILSFDSVDNELECAGNHVTSQPVIQNVAQFQTTYLEQIPAAGGTTVKYVTAANVTNWRSVQGVQVCLVLYGTEPINLPAGTDTDTVKSRSYTDCAGTSVDIAGLTGARKNRMHLVFTNVFQLRSQGLL